MISEEEGSSRGGKAKGKGVAEPVGRRGRGAGGPAVALKPRAPRRVSPAQFAYLKVPVRSAYDKDVHTKCP